jgi:hypothetical protein
MLKVQIRTDSQMTDEINESLKTNFNQLWWISVLNDSFDDNDDLYYAFEEEILDRYKVDYFSLAIKHNAIIDPCSTSTYPHDEHYFNSFSKANKCAKELVELLSQNWKCDSKICKSN